MILEHAKSKETFRTIGKPCGAKRLQSSFMFYPDIAPPPPRVLNIYKGANEKRRLCPSLSRAARYDHSVITSDRRQSKTLLKIDERG